MTLIIILPFVTGCREELLKGPVKGIITSYDQYNYAISGLSGVEIQMLHDSVVYAFSVTNSEGRFSFVDLPHGKYAVILKKEEFVMPYKINALNHIGGGVPFYSNYSIYEIPRFNIHLDSVGPGQNDYEKNIYLKIDGDTILRSKSNVEFIIFASGSPDVSKDNFIARGKGYLTTRKDYSTNTKIAVKGIVSYIDEITWIMKSYDSIYVAVYPLAGGQGYNYNEYLPESLGPSSNVIKCVWPERIQ